ncbi:MAG: host-nuclease inhibitor Gam family protein [Candidatus Kerfeldbacteria bacterium]|nr:host-nuclease inhibitor Gam family protein [Candidatus Kerfeldbacteria bacterium]
MTKQKGSRAPKPVTVPVPKSQEQLAERSQELRQNEDAADRLVAEYEIKLAPLRAEVARLEAELAERVASLDRQSFALLKAIFGFSEPRRDSLCGPDRKSFRVGDMVVGWRLGKWATVIDDEERFRAMLQRRGLAQYYEERVTINRQALLADRETVHLPGLSFEQGEDFYVVLPEKPYRLVKGARSVKKEPLRESA